MSPALALRHSSSTRLAVTVGPLVADFLLGELLCAGGLLQLELDKSRAEAVGPQLTWAMGMQLVLAAALLVF